jgi:hypothetical protein
MIHRQRAEGSRPHISRTALADQQAQCVIDEDDEDLAAEDADGGDGAR